ncbi:hypothetical protein MMC26_003979 [Xylographa opegraphella]|nr:hypothetical protein [Xylographa opegraphella]
MAIAYQVPPGGLYVTNPRTVVDIVARSLAVHCFAVCAYAHFRILVPWTLERRLMLVQMVLFMLVPELAIMQALLYVPFILFTARVPADCFAPKRLADVSGDHRKYRIRDSYGSDKLNYERPALPTVVQTDGEGNVKYSEVTFPWVSQLIFVFITSGPLIVTILAYKQRLALTYMVADYVGNLGLDHSNAWVSIGGMVAATGSVTLIFLKRSSTSEAVLSKATMLNPEVESYAPDVILCQAVICSMIHNVLLAATNHITPLSYVTHLGGGPLLTLLGAGLFIYWRRPKWRSATRAAVRGLAIFFVTTTAGTQLVSDIKELLDVSQGRVLPYNYRWKVKDWASSRSTAS